MASGDLCTWERLGPDRAVLATDTGTGQVLVEVRATDAGFSSSPGCGTWRTFAPGPPLPSFGPGTFAVGAQVAPGRWRSDGADLCCWERLSGRHGLDELLAGAGLPGHRGPPGPHRHRLPSFGCGTWHPVP